ncbi:MAG: hypothetical protein UD936_00555 [Acutalibacteraceae bacterium]|nr:hypothetical protein [Acutalibacteraceae bacterium]
MSINITEILNSIKDELNSSVDKTEVYTYFTAKRLSSPLKDKYSAVIGVKNDSTEFSSNSHTATFYIELLSPLYSDGESIFSKAFEISQSLIDMNISSLQSCVIGDIKYIASQRCYSINITFTVSGTHSDKAVITIDKDIYECAVVSEKAVYTSCDIKVYGSSKPVDSILSGSEFLITIQAPPGAELHGRLTELKSQSYKYLNCFVQSQTVYGSYIEYRLISHERVLL